MDQITSGVKLLVILTNLVLIVLIIAGNGNDLKRKMLTIASSTLVVFVLVGWISLLTSFPAIDDLKMIRSMVTDLATIAVAIFLRLLAMGERAPQTTNQLGRSKEE